MPLSINGTTQTVVHGSANNFQVPHLYPLAKLPSKHVSMSKRAGPSESITGNSQRSSVLRSDLARVLRECTRTFWVGARSVSQEALQMNRTSCVSLET